MEATKKLRDRDGKRIINGIFNYTEQVTQKTNAV